MEIFDEENVFTQMQDQYDTYLSEDGIFDHEKDNQAYQTVIRNELLHHIDNMMSQLLSSKEKSITERYFGIGMEAHKPSRIAQDIGISEQQVVAVVENSVRKLRESDYAIYLYQYLHGKRI